MRSEYIESGDQCSSGRNEAADAETLIFARFHELPSCTRKKLLDLTYRRLKGFTMASEVRQDKNALVVYVERDGQIQGWTAYVFGWVMVYVRRSQRRKGLAGRLVMEMTKYIEPGWIHSLYNNPEFWQSLPLDELTVRNSKYEHALAWATLAA